ncbi:hypothetical protein CKO15_10490 [Halorhodospira abdelmalekii]|nr:hypothetical protein [Halorhodospira abdelmalekii]
MRFVRIGGLQGLQGAAAIVGRILKIGSKIFRKVRRLGGSILLEPGELIPISKKSSSQEEITQTRQHTFTAITLMNVF